MVDRTLPTIVRWLELHPIATAGGAGNAIGPTARNDVLAAIIGAGEIEYRFLKGGGFGCHKLSMADCGGVVKYILAFLSSTPSTTYSPQFQTPPSPSAIPGR